MALKIANCIITPPNNDFTILYVKTKAFNDLSLPGKTLSEGDDVQALLKEAVKDKTGIIINHFKDNPLNISYEAKGELFERVIYAVSEHEGVPLGKEDMQRYGTAIYSPNLLYTSDWQAKQGHKIAPGIRQTIIHYYATLPDFSDHFPDFTPLTEDNLEELCTKVD